MESYGNDRMSFDKAFGRLIRQKRGVEGLTQQELAVLAFGKEANKTRISELENGRVANPQAKTVDALIIALKISQDKIDQLDVEHRDPYMIDTLAGLYMGPPRKGRLRSCHLVGMGSSANGFGTHALSVKNYFVNSYS